MGCDPLLLDEIDGLPSVDRRPPPPEPTSFLPGTPEKVAVLAERARLGYQLHHPQDARWEDATPGQTPRKDKGRPTALTMTRLLMAIDEQRGFGWRKLGGRGFQKRLKGRDTDV